MKVSWWQAGLHLEPENVKDHARLLAIETAMHSLAGMQIKVQALGETFSSAELISNCIRVGE